MNWREKREWFLYGVKNGPYVVDQQVEGVSYTAWLLGHKCVGSYPTLKEAQEACEKEAEFIRYPHKRGAGAE